MARSPRSKNDGNGKGQLGFEAELLLAADKLRKSLEPSDYKHVVLGLIFLKYISDAFEALHARLLATDPQDAEDPDQYLAERVFWVPKEARWSHLQASAKLPSIGKIIDDAMLAIEARNLQIKGVLPKDYARPANANGSTLQEISNSNFRPIGLIRPADTVLRLFEYTCRPLYERLVVNVEEASTLASLRDLLLPKLMSGEIRIREAEKLVGEAV